MAVKKKSAAPQTTSVVTTPEWEGMTPGDPVKVSAPRLVGKRGYRWTFHAHVVNTATGAEWIDCVGGRSGHEGIASFQPEFVTPIRRKTRRKVTKA